MKSIRTVAAEPSTDTNQCKIRASKWNPCTYKGVKRLVKRDLVPFKRCEDDIRF
jgi:hypothetical protein